jgi:hypothetical protein
MTSAPHIQHVSASPVPSAGPAHKSSQQVGKDQHRVQARKGRKSTWDSSSIALDLMMRQSHILRLMLNIKTCKN